MADRAWHLDALEADLLAVVRAGSVELSEREGCVVMVLELAGLYSEVEVRGSVADPATVKTLRRIATACRPWG